MFAAFARYKRESYRHSEFAPRILNDNGLKVVMKVRFAFSGPFKPMTRLVFLFQSDRP